MLGIEQSRLPDKSELQVGGGNVSEDEERPQVHSMEMEVTYYSI